VVGDVVLLENFGNIFSIGNEGLRSKNGFLRRSYPKFADRRGVRTNNDDLSAISEL
jgi:hypothetical protein